MDATLCSVNESSRSIELCRLPGSIIAGAVLSDFPVSQILGVDCRLCATLVGAAPHVMHVNADDVWNIVDGKKILVK